MDGTNDVKAELEATKAELAKLRAERDNMAAQAQQRRIADSIAEALAKRIDARAAAEMARVVAQEVSLTADGTLWHPELCAAGAEAIANGFLDGKGQYLLQTAPIGGRQNTAPAGPTWDIERAIADLKYDQEWQQADAEGNRAAWDKLLKSRSQPVYR